MKQRLEDFARECNGMGRCRSPGIPVRFRNFVFDGQGVALDYVTAHKWFNLAAEAGITEAWELGADVASQMSKDDLAEALRAARQ